MLLILFRFIISSFLSPYILKDQQVLRRHQKPLPNINNIFAIAIALNKLFLLKMRHIPHLVMKRSTNITSSSYAHQKNKLLKKSCKSFDLQDSVAEREGDDIRSPSSVTR